MKAEGESTWKTDTRKTIKRKIGICKEKRKKSEKIEKKEMQQKGNKGRERGKTVLLVI